MAYDLKDLLSSVKKDPASIRELANKIISGEVVALGTATLNSWAKTALSQLDGYDDAMSGSSPRYDQKGTDLAQKKLDKAYSWITGAAQPSKATRMYQKNDKAIAELKDDLANEASNLANTPERSREKLNQLSAQAVALGLDPTASADIVQNSAGEWIPREDAVKNDETEAAKNAEERMREGQTTTVRQAADGTYEIVGADGSVLETGLASEAGALARQQERQGGSTPQITGTSITATPEALADYSTMLSQAENDAAEALSDALADSDLTYMPKVTDADIDRYVAEGLVSAKLELDPYYSELIGRSTEAYQQAVTYEADARALELRQQEITAQQELDTAKGDLEARGATFSGEAAQLLGEEAALPEGLNTVVQGLLQEQQGLLASSTQQRYEQAQASLTQKAEEVLGTDATQAAGAELGLAEGLLRGLETSTAGSIAAERETNEQTRAQELANAQVATELAASSDFPTEELLSYV